MGADSKANALSVNVDDINVAMKPDMDAQWWSYSNMVIDLEKDVDNFRSRMRGQKELASLVSTNPQIAE